MYIIDSVRLCSYSADYHVQDISFCDEVADSEGETVAEVDAPVIDTERRSSVLVREIVGNE